MWPWMTCSRAPPIACARRASRWILWKPPTASSPSMRRRSPTAVPLKRRRPGSGRGQQAGRARKGRERCRRQHGRGHPGRHGRTRRDGAARKVRRLHRALAPARATRAPATQALARAATHKAAPREEPTDDPAQHRADAPAHRLAHRHRALRHDGGHRRPGAVLQHPGRAARHLRRIPRGSHCRAPARACGRPAHPAYLVRSVGHRHRLRYPHRARLGREPATLAVHRRGRP